MGLFNLLTDICEEETEIFLASLLKKKKNLMQTYLYFPIQSTSE